MRKYIADLLLNKKPHDEAVPLGQFKCLNYYEFGMKGLECLSTTPYIISLGNNITMLMIASHIETQLALFTF